MECICGVRLKGLRCERCGRVYKQDGTEDIEQTEKEIKEYIETNTSVLKHSICGEYYDFPHATEVTISEFSKDVREHKVGVREYLKAYNNHYLIEVKKHIEKDVGYRDISDHILRSIGYKYIKKEG